MSETSLEVLAERVDNWMSSTTEYRKELCKKIDNIQEVLVKLPCSERKGWYLSMGRQIGFMWFVISLLLSGVVGLTFKTIGEAKEIRTLKADNDRQTQERPR